ncbi:uncharacterized protein PV09_01152 [Verruconis gallopava]|uniref:Brix domain-containing protein n=1 Tax=Verruconis gallopava TaxID=253628 RepID=A0A0D2BA88_9PEZI|nr:uncharacterized protein PV09_01152 [Verruconis gallopava]KIW08224.1 hypothetical protein PV09_01152 [Verruconis gallopava]
MARRRTKKRTHIGAKNGKHANTVKSIERSPKSMVIRIGASEVGPSISQLVKDMRLVMEPGTASRLRERKSNKLRDYTTMCGPLGVTHLLLFSRSESGNTNLRIAITPRGPTLHFRVENYSLCKDVARSQRRPKNSKDLYLTAPLLVMNNFSTSSQNQPADGPEVPKHLESLVTTIFQSIFPPLNPQTTPLSSIKRVLLLNREPPSDPENSAYTISLRHYAITSRKCGLNKPIKRIYQAEKGDKSERRGRGVPNLGRLGDVSEYLLGGENGTNDGSYTSASETETDTDGEVEVMAPRTKKILGRKEREKLRTAAGENGGSNLGSESIRGAEKRAIKLTELGPRMRLRLIKVEEGLCGGKIMWHDHISKTKAEERELDQKWEQRRKEKEERKRIQRENVERKRANKQKKKEADGEDSDEEMEYDIDDDEYWQDAGDGDESGDEVDDEEDEDMEEG